MHRFKKYTKTEYLTVKERKKMAKFETIVSDFFLKEKGVNVSNLAYMKMPNEKEKYNLDKIIGNVNFTEHRFIIKSEADAIVADFLSMPLP